MKQCIDFLNRRDYLNLITVRVDKTAQSTQQEVFELAWTRLNTKI